MTQRYTQSQVKSVREVSRTVEGKPTTFVKFKGVLRYPEANPLYIDKPEGEDTRTAKQKRRTIYREVTKSLEIEKVQTRRGVSAAKARELTEARIQEAIEAWREEAEREAAMTDGAKTGFTEYARGVLDERNKASRFGMKKIEDSTLLDYSKTLRKLSPDFDTLAVGDITSRFVNSWYSKQLDAGASPNLVRKCHRLLSMVLRYAYLNEDIDNNPMTRVQAPNVPQKEADSLTHDGMRELTLALEAMEPTPVVVAGYIALHAGLRCSEICALRWRDVDFESGTLRVRECIAFRKGGTYIKARTKNGKSRVVGFDSEHMAKVLWRRRQLMLSEIENLPLRIDDLFVVGGVDGKYSSPERIERGWLRLVNDMGLRSQAGGRVNMHLLRHSYITASLEAGGSLQDVASNAGHASTQMTADTYATALNKGKKRAAALTGEWMRPRAEAEVYQLPRTGTEG